MGALTTHVLDLTCGRPAAGMDVTLARVGADGPAPIRRATTDADGRTREPLASGAELERGSYELTFGVDAYFGGGGFLEAVCLRFRVDDPSQDHHVPLLCTPWASSTYRGS